MHHVIPRTNMIVATSDMYSATQSIDPFLIILALKRNPQLPAGAAAGSCYFLSEPELDAAAGAAAAGAAAGVLGAGAALLSLLDEAGASLDALAEIPESLLLSVLAGVGAALP